MAIFSKIFAVAAGLLATASMAAAAFQGEGAYVFNNVAENLALDLSGGKCANGTEVVATTPVKQPHFEQAWVIAKVSSREPDRYWIVNAQCGTALTITKSGGQLIADYILPTDASQLWTLDTTSAGNGDVIFKSVITPTVVLTLEGSSDKSGTAVSASPETGADGTTRQQWSLTFLV